MSIMLNIYSTLDIFVVVVLDIQHLVKNVCLSGPLLGLGKAKMNNKIFAFNFLS